MGNWYLTLLTSDRDSSQHGKEQFNYSWSFGPNGGGGPLTLPPVMDVGDTLTFVVRQGPGLSPGNGPEIASGSTVTLTISSMESELPFSETIYNAPGELLTTGWLSGSWVWPVSSPLESGYQAGGPPGYYGLTNEKNGFHFRVTVAVTPPGSTTPNAYYTVDPEMVVGPTT